jgi:hypothetical protein
MPDTDDLATLRDRLAALLADVDAALERRRHVEAVVNAWLDDDEPAVLPLCTRQNGHAS